MKAHLLLLGLLLCGAIAAAAQHTPVAPTAVLPGHPRLLLLKGEEKTLKKQIARDALWQEIHRTILDESDRLTGLPGNERTLTGRRLLSISRDNLKRIFFLSYAYRMTGDKKYARRAESEMLKAASFSDWNPPHFLDVGEMTLAMAIGYDWLYPQLSPASRRTIETAIIEKGLKPSLDKKYNWFVDAVHNWNQVCHAGIACGALAVWEREPALAASLLNRAVEKMALPMQHYGPDGAYPEGVGYWEYGTSFNVVFLSAIEKIFKTDFGLSRIPGFLQTGNYVQHMLTPMSRNFNYSDNGAGASMTSTLFWFYDKTRDPSLLYHQAGLYRQRGPKAVNSDRFAPAMLIWGASGSLEKAEPPHALFWMGQGDSPVCAMRSGWGDPHALYLGVKLGSPSVNHAHMDAGSFIFEADSVNWAIDLGAENYNRLETRGVELWGSRQDDQRWDVYRYNNFAHNTLSFNDRRQNVKGSARIGRFSDDAGQMSVTSDLTPLYAGQVRKLTRTCTLADGRCAVIEDRIESSGRFTRMTWRMLTPAQATVVGDRLVMLEKEGRKLYLYVEGPEAVRWSIAPADPANSYDSPNPGIRILRFDTELKINAPQTIRVYLLPGAIEYQSAGRPVLPELNPTE